MATTQTGGIYKVGGKLVDAEGKPAKRMKLVEKRAEPTGGDVTPPAGGMAEDFPAREALVDGGFDSLDKVRVASDEQLLEIKGVGDATLKEIRKAQGS